MQSRDPKPTSQPEAEVDNSDLLQASISLRLGQCDLKVQDDLEKKLLKIVEHKSGCILQLKDGDRVQAHFIAYNRDSRIVFCFDKMSREMGHTHLSLLRDITEVPHPHKVAPEFSLRPVVTERMSMDQVIKTLIDADQELRAAYSEVKGKKKDGVPLPKWMLRFELNDGRVLTGRAAIGHKPENDLKQGKRFFLINDRRGEEGESHSISVAEVARVYKVEENSEGPSVS